MPPDDSLAAYCRYFEALTPDHLRQLGDFFAPQARFCDPFNDVRGIEGIRRIFAHMFATTSSPRFTVLEQSRHGEVAYIRWYFDFTPKGMVDTLLRIEGVSRVTFDAAGLVTEHQDYWDPASQLYERFPVIGRFFTWLRGRLAAR